MCIYRSPSIDNMPDSGPSRGKQAYALNLDFSSSISSRKVMLSQSRLFRKRQQGRTSLRPARVRGMLISGVTPTRTTPGPSWRAMVNAPWGPSR